jgi:hypothetical protein
MSPKVTGIVPRHNRFMRSMPSAPAIIPAISDLTFTPALAET